MTAAVFGIEFSSPINAFCLRHKFVYEIFKNSILMFRIGTALKAQASVSYVWYGNLKTIRIQTFTQ